MFLGETGEKIEDFPIYVKNMRKWKNWAKRNGYKYKFYSSKDIYPYLDKKLKKFYDGLRYKWQRIDFSRYVVLNQDGGVYVDLDIEPKNNRDFAKYVSSKDYVLNKWYDPKKKAYELNNALMGFPKNSLQGLINYSMDETESKSKIDTYKTWKVRFMLQTTGVRMFKRWCKLNGLTFSEEIHDYVQDHCTATWLKNFK